MDKLDMASWFIGEAKRERALIVEYKKDLRDMEFNEFCNKWKRTPSKTYANRCLQMARKYLLDEYME